MGLRLLPLVVLLLLAAASDISAQTAPNDPRPIVEFGLDPVAVVTAPAGSLVTIRGSEPCTDGYEGTTRVNLGLAAWATIMLGPGLVPAGDLAIRGVRFSVGVDDISSEFITEELNYEAYNDAVGSYMPVTTQFRTLFDLLYARTAVSLEGTLGPTMFLRLGLSGSFPLRASSSQEEQILSPSTAMFPGGAQERTIPEGTGTIDDAGVRIGATAAVAYRLRLGRHLFFEPTAEFDYGFTSILPEWSPLELRLGITLGYSVNDEAPEIVEAPPPMPVPLPPPTPTPPRPEPFAGSVDVSMAGDLDTVELRRQIVARYVPVIPVIFFELESDRISARYRTRGSSGGFDEMDIPAAADEAHRSVLDLLGFRLSRSPRSAVTLTGTTSGDEQDRERLGLARAASVADYLRREWRVQDGQVRVRSRIAPAVPSNEEYAEGREENRRVEVEVSDPALLDPVLIRSVEPVTEPSAVRFRPAVTVNAPVAGWRLDVTWLDDETPVTAAAGSGTPPPTIVWNLRQEDREAMLMRGRARYRLVVDGADGTSLSSAVRRIPLRLDTTVTVASSANRPVNAAEFLLITFEFNQARLNERGRRELATIIDRISPASAVMIVGYTDSLGTSGHNRALAEERGAIVRRELPAGTNATSRGAEPSEAPYPNATPEGRFLNRTVRVVVSDPK